MLHKISHIMFILAFSLMVAAPVFAEPDNPGISPALWADGKLWNTNDVIALPEPDAKNKDSFDHVFVVTNSNNPDGQMPIGKCAPDNANYNGGRWHTQTVEWTEAGLENHGTVPLLTSYQDIMAQEKQGNLTISSNAPEGGLPAYFQCSLSPVMLEKAPEKAGEAPEKTDEEPKKAEDTSAEAL